ncbi:hypothetical protein BH11ARM2_BH11ARM2_02350 [soil metagenome]
MLALLLPLAMAQTISITDFGARGGGGDDTAAIQKALDQARDRPGTVVTVPKGEFEVSNLTLYGNTTLEGSGPDSVIRRAAGSKKHMLSINPGEEGSADPNKNQKNITIRSLTLRDLSDESGTDAHQHTLNANGVTNLRVESVNFLGFRGDGIYLGSGNSQDRNTERHNLDVTISKCKFDGLNRQNRNAITVIDGVRVAILDNFFTRSSDKGPGAIDLEPNKQAFHWIQDIQIDRNTFTDNGHGCIKADIPITNSELQKPFTGLSIRKNVIKGSDGPAIQLYQKGGETPDRIPNNIVVDGNTVDDAETGITLRGLSGVQITGNKFEDTRNGVQIGLSAFVCDNISVIGNTFRNIGGPKRAVTNSVGAGGRNKRDKEGPGAAAVAIRNATRVTITDNTVTTVRDDQGGAAPFVLLANKGNTSGVKVQNNQVTGVSMMLETQGKHNAGGDRGRKGEN